MTQVPGCLSGDYGEGGATLPDYAGSLPIIISSPVYLSGLNFVTRLVNPNRRVLNVIIRTYLTRLALYSWPSSQGGFGRVRDVDRVCLGMTTPKLLDVKKL